MVHDNHMKVDDGKEDVAFARRSRLFRKSLLSFERPHTSSSRSRKASGEQSTGKTGFSRIFTGIKSSREPVHRVKCQLHVKKLTLRLPTYRRVVIEWTQGKMDSLLVFYGCR